MSTHSEPGLVSVVIPAYGRPEYLDAAVESVNDQTYGPIELVVVDDCSPDPIEPIVEDATTDALSSVRVVRHEVNRGANAARNTGIEASNGEFVAFLDDDDYWRPTKVEKQVAAFEAGGKEVGFVYTGQENVSADGTTTNYRVPSTRGWVTRDLFRGASLCPFSSVMVRRSVVDEVGLLDTRFPSWQDREWYLRISEACAFEVVEEPLAVRRVDSHGQISDNYEQKRDVSYPLFLEKHRPLARKYGKRHEKALVAAQSRSLGHAALMNGRYRDAVRFLLRSVRYDPSQTESYPALAVALGGERTVGAAQRLKRFAERLRGSREFGNSA
ncbi:glycosyltransferase family 2 protein [Halogeometricum limi]|uniref:Glycosyltransferase involved in cell wall bisynthesis n=1 Tax=Halogeometricum limi TaxID=555875 RepID=A0A1I6IIL5_9EURY|nr:glycosyltransferase family 2 protein [Halogeometricum limi]SFR66499.1 Glycosyltransferase involved in cell wall bisynthesis [Halogeometricum limi]